MRREPHAFLRPMSNSLQRSIRRTLGAPARGSSAAALAVLVVLAVPGAVGPALAAVTTTTIETFDGPLEDATWRLDNFSIPGVPMTDEIESSGGHSGAFLRNPVLWTTAPNIRYIGPLDGSFLGDYRAAGVISLGVDVNIFSAELGRDGPWRVGLNIWSGTDTPDNEYDDCRVFVEGARLPQVGGGWKSITFKVPSGRPSLPPDLSISGICDCRSQDDAWNFLITHVSQVNLLFGGGTYATYRMWDVGIDSVRITSRQQGAVEPAPPTWTPTP